jgi:hypothetical protein
MIGGDDARRLGQLSIVTCCSLEPFAVRLAAGQLLLDLGVGDDALLDRIDQEHAARPQAALLANVFGRNFKNAGFGGQHHQVVLGDDVAAGAQAVAVQRGADHAAVGERHGRRPSQGSISEAWYS